MDSNQKKNNIFFPHFFFQKIISTNSLKATNNRLVNGTEVNKDELRNSRTQNKQGFLVCFNGFCASFANRKLRIRLFNLIFLFFFCLKQTRKDNRSKNPFAHKDLREDWRKPKWLFSINSLFLKWSSLSALSAQQTCTSSYTNVYIACG